MKVKRIRRLVMAERLLILFQLLAYGLGRIAGYPRAVLDQSVQGKDHVVDAQASMPHGLPQVVDDSAVDPAVVRQAWLLKAE